MAKPAAKPRKKANGYKMPEPMPNGLVLEDVTKKKWKIGPSIGKGGFGEIYSAQADGPKKSSTYPFVVKIEPHENGPLFVEMHFYMRNAKTADVEAFIAEKKLTNLGMPRYLGSGSLEYKGDKYRFVVMDKFGSDIWKLFLANKRCFPVPTVFKLGVQILDVLEYIHSKGYIHADIKGANILLGVGGEAKKQVYLVDFGLCSHYDGSYKPDPKKAHNGTIEYLSRDAHKGVESRRGDLEILGYNLTQWLGCTLPWEKDIADPIAVQQSKEKHMENLPGFFKACFKNGEPPGALVDYMKYVTTLKFETNPDYKKLRKILISGVEAAGGSLNSPFKFEGTKATPVKRKATSATPDKKAKLSKKKLEVESEEDEEENIPENGKQIAKKVGRKPKTAPKVVVEEDSDDEAPQTKTKPTKTKASNKKQPVEPEPGGSQDSGVVYTSEMLRIINQMDAKKKQGKRKVVESSDRMMRQHKNVNYSPTNKNKGRSQDVNGDSNSTDEEEISERKKTVRRGRK